MKIAKWFMGNGKKKQEEEEVDEDQISEK